MKPYFDTQCIYKDTAHRKISGVCAGLANHWGIPRLFVRVGAIVCLITLPTITAIAYITATLLIPNR